MLEDNLPDVPHLQGADRVALAGIAVEELESEVLVLDDGFQHRRLARDLDLVLLDATEPWGHGHLFPRGLLREPPSSLRRADAVLLTRCDQVTGAAVHELAERSSHARPRPAGRARRRIAPVAWLQHDRRRSAARRASRPAGGGVLRHRQPGGLSPHPARPGRRADRDFRTFPGPSRLHPGRRGRPANLGPATAGRTRPGRRRRRTWSSCGSTGSASATCWPCGSACTSGRAGRGRVLDAPAADEADSA